MASPMICPACENKLPRPRGGYKDMTQCPGCRASVLLDPRLGAYAAMPDDRRSKVMFVYSKAAIRRDEEFTQRAARELRPLFRGLPKAREAWRRLLARTARRAWVQSRGLGSETFIDLLVGTPVFALPLTPREARRYKYREELGWDRRGRLVWERRPDDGFTGYEYEGSHLKRAVTFDAEDALMKVELVASPRRALSAAREKLRPAEIRLFRRSGRVVRTVTRQEGRILEERLYRRVNGQVVERIVHERGQLSYNLLAPGGTEFEQRDSVSRTDVARNRILLAREPRQPLYLKPASGSGKALGRFNAPFDGPVVPACPGGGHTMRCLLHVPPVMALWCDHCSYCVDRTSDEGAWHVDFSDPVRPRPFSLRRHGPPERTEGAPSGEPRRALPLPPSVSIQHQNYHKLGGWPLWLQGNEWPRCPRCHGVPDFWGQVTSDEGGIGFYWGDSGIVYVFWCPTCRVTSSTIQCL